MNLENKKENLHYYFSYSNLFQTHTHTHTCKESGVAEQEVEVGERDINPVWVHQQRRTDSGFGGFWKLRSRVLENGGEARDGVDIDTGDAESVYAGDTDADGAEVAEAGVEPGGEGLDGVDSDVVYIS